jgi:hypothetical protein
MCMYPLSRIYNTRLVSAYFGLDKRECECLEYLFLLFYFTQNCFRKKILNLFYKNNANAERCVRDE